MATSNLYTLENTKMTTAILAAAALFIIFVGSFGSFGVFLAEHGHPGANITNYGDAVWWAVVTVATVGYGDYYPVTAVGRIIAIFMMIRYLCSHGSYICKEKIAESRDKIIVNQQTTIIIND